MAPKLSLYLVLGIVAAILHLAVGKPFVSLFIQHGALPWVWEAQVLLGLAIGLVVIGLSRYASTHWRWTQTIDAEFHLMLGELTGREILILALLSSTIEEIFFRGFLQGQIGVAWAQSRLVWLISLPSSLSALDDCSSRYWLAICGRRMAG